MSLWLLFMLGENMRESLHPGMVANASRKWTTNSRLYRSLHITNTKAHHQLKTFNQVMHFIRHTSYEQAMSNHNYAFKIIISNFLPLIRILLTNNYYYF